jgi:microcystin-dependent protein
MPRNSGGVYSPPAGTYGVPNTVISSPAYDTFVNDIGAEITNSVNVQGTAPMLAPLNMGAFRIINASSPVAATDVAIKSYVDAAVSPGFVMGYANNSSAPAGWLICNGASLSTTTYANLFAVIGYAFGGSGANFNIPDYRGCFLRGFDNGRGLDFQGTRGPNTFQASYLTNHFHAVQDSGHVHNITDPSHVHPDPGHAHVASQVLHNHTYGAILGGGSGIQSGTGWSAQTFGTGNAQPVITVNAALTNLQNAFTGINSTLSAQALVSVTNVSTGSVNYAETETTVQNYPLLWCIKY